ncbi:MAG: tRNA 2-thiouridine(34) synthase MnmA [Deltaproteobacteria bacterium]|nr:tRNA 2-thiouridine(34) synthase MnmA [Deltaproteobacteria bacterium]
MSDLSKNRVAVAMSGGVDSSTALAVLKEQGYECVGLTMQLWDYSKGDMDSPAREGSCCSLDDVRDTRCVADGLDVPFYVLNMEKAFSREVVDYFVKDYMSGRTPNPCVKCNQLLKFDALLKKALSLEADFLATGHYARIVRDGHGYKLLKGLDKDKDQSYFLFTMTQAQLARTLFPLGEMTKRQVRAKAKALGLKSSDKEESQEICFIDEPSYADFLASVGGDKLSRPGDIVSCDGAVLGLHKGLFRYTIGQRKGLGLSSGPYYVLAIDTATNKLIVGREQELYSTGLVADNVNWIDDHAALEAVSSGLENVSVKIRYRHEGADASIRVLPDGLVHVRLKTAQKAVTPGQAVVFYRDEVVLGGGWIERAVS